MAVQSGDVVLLTSDAPYLGGHATWLPLRKAAPEVRFVEIDTLDAPKSQSLIDAVRLLVRGALPGAAAVIAHGNSASLAIEEVAALDAPIPVLLLSPRMFTKRLLLLRMLRSFFGGIGKPLLIAIARSKRRRLLHDEPYLRKQFTLLARGDAVTDDLIREARERIADPRMEWIVERTAEVANYALTPVDPHVYDTGPNRSILLGMDPYGRKVRTRCQATVLEDAWSALMLEKPDAVASHLRTLLART